jgi:large subunit ribosomal protein L30
MAKKKEKTLRIKLVKSPIGYPQRQKDTVYSLGLRRMHQVVEHSDTAMIRGMVAKVIHLVQIEEVE